MRASWVSSSTPTSTGRRVVIVTAADIPGDNIIASIKADQPVLVDRRDPPSRGAGRPAGGARPGDVARRQAGRPAPHPASAAGLRPARVRASEFAHYEVGTVTWRRRSRPPTWSSRATYRVGHQEQLYIENQGMIADPAGRRRRHGPRLAPMPLLRPPGTQAGARPQRQPGGRRSRPRPEAASEARRSTPRSWRSMRRCWRASPGTRCA